MSYRVDITDAAMTRILEQARYIAVARGEPQNAEVWLRRVFEAADALEQMPRRCRRALEDGLGGFEVRELHVASFVLLFTVSDDDTKVRVFAARHARQLPGGRLGPETCEE